MSTKEQQIWDDIAASILSTIKSTADRVSTTWPHITLVDSRIWNTEAFLINVYGTFKNSLSPESEGIDICIVFKRRGEAIEVTADICRESGEELDEIFVSHIPADERGIISEEKARGIGEEVARYIQDRWELIGKELSKTSDS